MLTRISFVVAMVFSITSHADVFKCVGSDGKVSYSSVKCSGAQKVEQFYSVIPPARTETPVRRPSIKDDAPPPAFHPADKEESSQTSKSVTGLPLVKGVGESDCSFERSEVKSVQRAMKNWYPASMSGHWHERLRMANKNLTRCEHNQQ